MRLFRLPRTPHRGDRSDDRRRALWAAGAAAVVTALLVWCLLPSPGSTPSGTLTMTTGVPSGVYARYGELLRQRVERDLPRVTMRLHPSEGSVENLARVATGRADLTIAQADVVADYLDTGRPGSHRLRACARLYDDYLQLLVPADSPVRRVRDLRGLRVGVGETGSGVAVTATRLLRAAGLSPGRDLTTVSRGIDAMPRLLAEHELDAFFWSGGLPTTAVHRLAERTPVRLVPLGDLLPELRRQGVGTRHYRAAVMPADAYPSMRHRRPVETIAVPNLLVTTDRADAELIEGVTRSVIRGRDRIGREVHAAQLVDLRTAIYTDPLALHEGAEHYYRSTKS